MTPPCLALENVSRHYGGLKAVDKVNLVVQPGERRAVIGPNGAGKTTLFNVISGEVRASEGTIALFGEDVTALAPHQRAVRGMARTFQITKLFPSFGAMTKLSASRWWIRRHLAAPMAVRTANSWRRAWTLDIIKPATFTQQRSRTIATSPCIRYRGVE